MWPNVVEYLEFVASASSYNHAAFFVVVVCINIIFLHYIVF